MASPKDTVSAQEFGDARTRRAPTAKLAPKLAPLPSTRTLLDVDRSYTLGEVLGEGGMGIVRAAMQPSLQRVVAVKTLKLNATVEDQLAVLREAWVTGFLEHPNIVPVHEIALDDSGAPLVVMRRIDGRSWHDCLRDPAWASAAGARDLLEQNLRILIQVCNALVFAHQNGVVHRDVKPGNVMLGKFGEVYLLDWGISCALFGDALNHLPAARDAIEPAGTIPYLAPEMAGITKCGISERSDVYLVGAVLFEIATGNPPHPVELASALASIAASPPPLPAGVPPDLAAICKRAMQHDPAARHPSVAALRDDIQLFLMHRDSLHVAAEGRALIAELRAAIASNAPRRVLYDLWGECRFALREALRTWPENTQASDALRIAGGALAEHELTRDPRVAAAILDEIAEPPSTLRSRVQAAVLADERERHKNAAIASELDPGRGWRFRNVLYVIAGVLWTTSALVGDHIGPWTNERFLVGSALPIPVLLYIRFATSLRATLFNRRSLNALICLCAAHVGLFAVCAGLHVDVATARTLQVGVALIVAIMTAMAVDARLWPMTLGLAAAVAVAVLAPTARAWATAAAYFGVTINFAIVWRTHQRMR
ncbi:MAG TPA: serine/threonine-protein kinase [Polyangiaceae bacterium]|jgi:serine/threonine-protein kinase